MILFFYFNFLSFHSNLSYTTWQFNYILTNFDLQYPLDIEKNLKSFIFKNFLKNNDIFTFASYLIYLLKYLALILKNLIEIGISRYEKFYSGLENNFGSMIKIKCFFSSNRELKIWLFIIIQYASLYIDATFSKSHYSVSVFPFPKVFSLSSLITVFLS